MLTTLWKSGRKVGGFLCLTWGAAWAEPTTAAADVAAHVDTLKGDGAAIIARIDTSLGVINCQLRPEHAPRGVARFAGLAMGTARHKRKGKRVLGRFYDGLTFHRVIPQFVIQGGDPLGTGAGGSGIRYRVETSDSLKHDAAGVLSLVGLGGWTDSQFFILDKPQDFLDGRHTVIGRCTDLEVVRKIARVKVKPPNRPRTPVVIKRIDVSKGAPLTFDTPAAKP